MSDNLTERLYDLAEAYANGRAYMMRLIRRGMSPTGVREDLAHIVVTMCSLVIDNTPCYDSGEYPELI